MRRPLEKPAIAALFLCAFISIATTFGIIAVLFRETAEFFQMVSPFEFLTGTRWEPLIEPQSFGVLPLVCGTLIVVIGAGILAVPAGVLTAIYFNEYGGKKFRNTAKPVLELLAGIPTVVYGYFALTFVTPILQRLIPGLEIFNAFSACIVVGIMILPMVTSLCDDAIAALPRGLKEGGFAMGATTFEVTRAITLPAVASRVLAAVVLALSRALGETMAVTLAAGATPRFSLNPFQSIQTMTAYIVQVSLGDTPAGGVEYLTCFAVGSLLFLITLGMNIVAQRLLFKSARNA